MTDRNNRGRFEKGHSLIGVVDAKLIQRPGYWKKLKHMMKKPKKRRKKDW